MPASCAISTAKRSNSAGREARGRLVHGDDAGVLEEGAGDLDHLLLGDLELADGDLGVDGGVEVAQHLGGAAFLAPPIDQEAAGLLQGASQEHVLRHREVRDVLELLVDHGDPGGAGLQRRSDLDRTAVDLDVPLVGLEHRRQDVEERGLARAVLAQKAVDLAGADLEGDVVEGADAGKALGDAGELQPAGVMRTSQATFARGQGVGRGQTAPAEAVGPYSAGPSAPARSAAMSSVA